MNKKIKLEQLKNNIFTKYPSRDVICFLNGDESENLSDVATYFINHEIKTILVPKNVVIKNSTPYFEIFYENVRIRVFESIQKEEWILGMYTSGSTSDPKLFTFTKEQISLTLDWYERIYPTTADSIIVSLMPVSYNFTFIAGVLNAIRKKCKFKKLSPEDVIHFLNVNTEKFDRIIILANPVILDILSKHIDEISDKSKIMIDSGGAPLSTACINWFYQNGIKIYEGYGLTETCSLTHFNTTISEANIGTVGNGFPGVETNIMTIEGKPRIVINSKNIGREFSTTRFVSFQNTSTLVTGDIGRIRKNGSLEILGRSSDTCVNGFWPKDTLEFLGSSFPTQCILVEHLTEDFVRISFYQKITSEELETVRLSLSKKLQIKPQNIEILESCSELTDSMKLQRKKWIVFS